MLNQWKKKLEENCDVATNAKTNMAEVCWNDNKIVNVLSTFAGKDLLQKAKRYNQEAMNGSESYCLNDPFENQEVVVASVSFLH